MNADALLNLIKPNIFTGHSLQGELIVSLTSYPARYDILRLTLKSLLQQTMKADRILLWLYDEDYRLLPQSIKEMSRAGVQIKLLKHDIKSYKKSLPTLQHFPEAFVVTCDDDILFKPTFIEELVEAYKMIGGVIAHRAHLLQFEDNGDISEYNSWLKNAPGIEVYEINSPLVFPTTGAGVLYPPKTFDARVLDINAAMRTCPTADDVWLYYMMISNGSTASVISNKNFLCLSNEGKDSLWSVNQTGENDRQLNDLMKTFGCPSILLDKIHSVVENQKTLNATKLKNGMSMVLLDDHIGSIIKATGCFYEQDLINFVKRLAFPKTVLDVGSNIGNHALGWSGHDEYKVFCFEPDAKLAEIARQNLEMNSVDFELFIHGCGREYECLPFVSGDETNSGVGSFKRDAESDRTLEILPIDDINIPRSIDLIKIDVEGFELDVLLGAKETIFKHQPILVVEHHNYECFDRCRCILMELGYKPISVHCATPTFVYVHSEKFGLTNSTETTSWVDDWSEFNQ